MAAGGGAIPLAVAVGAAAAVGVDGRQWWFAVTWAAWGATVVWAFAVRPASLAVIALQGYVLVEILLPATVAVTEGRTVLGRYDATTGTTTALALTALAQLALLAGAAAARAWRSPPTQPRRVPCPISRWQADRLAVLLLVAAVVSVMTYVVIARGDPRQLLVLAGDAQYNAFGREASGPLVKYFQVLVALAGVAIMVVAMRIGAFGWRRPVVPAGVGLASAALLAAGGGRWYLIVAVAGAALVWLRSSPSALIGRPRSLVVVGFALVALYAVLAGGLRDQSGAKQVDFGTFVDKQARGGVFATTAALVDAVPDRVDHAFGRTYAEVVALPVPRALWPGKPEGTVREVLADLFDEDIGAAFPFYGEAYLNFGWPGALAATAVFGFLLETAWRKVLAAQRAAQLLGWALAVPILVQLFSRGYLAGVLAAAFGFLVGGVLVVMYVRRHRLPEDGSLPEPVVPGAVPA